MSNLTHDDTDVMTIPGELVVHEQQMSQEHMIHHQTGHIVDEHGNVHHLSDDPSMHIGHNAALQLHEVNMVHQHHQMHHAPQEVDAHHAANSGDMTSVIMDHNGQQMQVHSQDRSHMMSVANAAAAAAAIEEHMNSSDSHLSSADAHMHPPTSHPHQHQHQHQSVHSSNSPSKSKRVQTRRSWTPEEDKRLLELVKVDGTNCWSQIATHLEGRVGKQCRERWRNHLDPNIRRDSFSPEEDEHILELVQELGTRWSKIAQRLPGRTENAVKNRYHCFLKNRDTNGTKRSRDDKHNGGIGLNKKRLHSDKGFIGFDGDLNGGKGSPEGNYSCNLLGCGKHFSQLSHLLAHRLTHFAEGRHPSSQPTQVTVASAAPVAMDPSQRPPDTPAETVMLVRALDGLVDDLLSHIQPRPQGEGKSEHEHDHDHNNVVTSSSSVQQQQQQAMPQHIIKSEHVTEESVQDSNNATMVTVAMLGQHHMHVSHMGYGSDAMDLGAHHVEQYVVADKTAT